MITSHGAGGRVAQAPAAEAPAAEAPAAEATEAPAAEATDAPAAEATAATDAPATQDPATTSRFKPTRAGIINLWDYTDEEFVFADGRLALRGHNGSGKTKALEVLFPFVLDGSLDARRLDPFSGENRTMKANLLYRGQDAEHGYVWMEFARPDETVTLIIGLTAHRNWDRPRPAFYLTGQRMGADFGLLSADSRPLTTKQLTAILGRDAYLGDRKGVYQEAVDTRLFGLGRERYTQLLDLLIALRRPLLAKDLDPAKVSDTLTAGLSPIDEDLLQQAARDFENLAAIQKTCDDLAAADAAVRTFLVQYTDYLRVHAQHQLGQVTARLATAAGHGSAITAAARTVARARQEQQRAADAGQQAKTTVDTFDARLFALKNRDAYKDHEKLALRRGQLDKEARDLAAEQARLARAQADVAELRREADDVAARQADLARAAARHSRILADAAERAGLARDGEPADTGDDLPVTARARAAARRDDIAAVRAQLAPVRDAEQGRGRAEAALATARQAVTGQDQACAVAADRLAGARAELAGELRAWAGRWASDEPYPVITAGQAAQLIAAVEHIGELDTPGLGELFGSLTRDAAAALIASGEQLRSRAGDLAAREARLTAERDAIAAERDDAPPGSDLRPADRAGRPGAPLWQLVRFTDDLSPEAAAAIEGALSGSGLLTAWIHPDPALTAAALDKSEADSYLVALSPAARPGGKTLADVLVPEQQDMVPPDLVAGVLASVCVADGPVVKDAAPDGLAGLVVTARAQYRAGPFAGARPKPGAEFIGATNRASRRQARLAELDAEIAAAAQQRAAAGAELRRVDEARADLSRAQQELPRTGPVAGALRAVTHAGALRSAAADRLGEAQTALDTAIAELDAQARRLRRTGADRDLAAAAAEVDAAERAVAEFERAADDLIRGRAAVAALDRDLAGRQARIGRLAGENDDAAAMLAENQAAHLASAEKLSIDERAGGAEYEQITSEIAAAERELAGARGALRAARDAEAAEHDALVRAQADLEHGRQALASAVTELTAQAAGFAPYARRELRPLLEVTETALWPEPGQWPDPEQATAALMEALISEDDPAQPEAAIRAVLPAGAVAILDAFSQLPGPARPATPRSRARWTGCGGRTGTSRTRSRRVRTATRRTWPARRRSWWRWPPARAGCPPPRSPARSPPRPRPRGSCWNSGNGPCWRTHC